MAGSEFCEEISEGSRKKANQENSTLAVEAVETEEKAEKRCRITQTRRERAKHGTKSKPRYRRRKMRASHWFCYR